LLSKKHLVLAKNEIQAMTTNQSALVGDRPSSVAALQELMRWKRKFSRQKRAFRLSEEQKRRSRSFTRYPTIQLRGADRF
jgi:hypothetical protein